MGETRAKSQAQRTKTKDKNQEPRARTRDKRQETRDHKIENKTILNT